MIEGHKRFISTEAIKTGKVHTLRTSQGVIKFIQPRNTINRETFILKAKPITEESLNTNHIVKIQLNFFTRQLMSWS